MIGLAKSSFSIVMEGWKMSIKSSFLNICNSLFPNKWHLIEFSHAIKLLQNRQKHGGFIWIQNWMQEWTIICELLTIICELFAKLWHFHPNEGRIISENIKKIWNNIQYTSDVIIKTKEQSLLILLKNMKHYSVLGELNIPALNLYFIDGINHNVCYSNVRNDKTMQRKKMT